MNGEPAPGHLAKRVYGDEVQYNLHWSPLRAADRYVVTKQVPAVAGVYELYLEERPRKLVRFLLAMAWYGGLRGAIRERSDAEATLDRDRRALLARGRCYFRYCCIASLADLSDVFYFLDQQRDPESAARPSGRYQSITVAVRTPGRPR